MYNTYIHALGLWALQTVPACVEISHRRCVKRRARRMGGEATENNRSSDRARRKPNTQTHRAERTSKASVTKSPCAPCIQPDHEPHDVCSARHNGQDRQATTLTSYESQIPVCTCPHTHCFSTGTLLRPTARAIRSAGRRPFLPRRRR